MSCQKERAYSFEVHSDLHALVINDIRNQVPAEPTQDASNHIDLLV